MNKQLKPMTKEELGARTDIPEVHKKAIEHAIWEGVAPDDPEDKVWPDFFRAEEVECQLECEIHEDDELANDEYERECIWFSVGWKAREKAAQQKLIKGDNNSYQGRRNGF